MGRFRQEYTGSHWNIEAVFRAENFRCIPIAFLCFPPGTGRKSPEIFRPEYCFHVPVASGVFLQVPSGSGHRNLRPVLLYDWNKLT